MTLKGTLCAVIAAVMLFALTACKSGSADKPTIKLNGVTVSAPLTFTFDKDNRVSQIPVRPE